MCCTNCFWCALLFSFCLFAYCCLYYVMSMACHAMFSVWYRSIYVQFQVVWQLFFSTSSSIFPFRMNMLGVTVHYLDFHVKLHSRKSLKSFTILLGIWSLHFFGGFSSSWFFFFVVPPNFDTENKNSNNYYELLFFKNKAIVQAN